MAVNKLDISYSDMDDVPNLIAQTQHEQTSEQPWEALNEGKQKKKVSRAKSKLNNEVVSRTSYDQLCEMDPNGEIESWFKAIHVLLDIQQAYVATAVSTEVTDKLS